MPRNIYVDNKPPVMVFDDTNRIGDGLAHLAGSVVMAPQIEAQIRQRREAEDLQNSWQEREFTRRGERDDLSQLWHEQERDYRTGRDAKMDQRNQSQEGRAWLDGIAKVIAAKSGKSGAAGAAKEPKIHMMPNDEGFEVPYVMGEDGRLYQVDMQNIPQPPEPETPQTWFNTLPWNRTDSAQQTESPGVNFSEPTIAPPQTSSELWGDEGQAQAQRLSQEAAAKGKFDLYAGQEQKNIQPDNYVMQNIMKTPAMRAKWDTLDADKQAQLQAILELPDGPRTARLKQEALARFANYQP